MPEYRSCARIRALAASDEDISERDQMLGWLCGDDNRVDLNGRRAQFLEDLHDSYHDHGRLTELQFRGLRRWWERAQNTSNRPASATPLTPTANPEDSYDGLHVTQHRWTGEVRRMGAVWNQAQWVYSGEYEVHQSNLSIKYKIHTLTQASNSNIVGKRVVSAYQDNRWVTFAFVSISGSLTLWNRFQEHDNDTFVMLARYLLESFRATDRDGDYTSWDFNTGDDRHPRIHVQRTELLCRRCNGTMSDPDDRDNGTHDHDCSRNRTSAIAERRARTPRTVDMDPLPVDHNNRPVAQPGSASPAHRPLRPATPVVNRPSTSPNMSEVNPAMVQ